MSLIVDNVSFSYDNSLSSKALSDISFQIEPSDFIGITGVTGSGKTTLVKILAGLLEPQSGKVKNSIGEAGFVFQYPEAQLFEESVLKDVMYGPENLGKSEAEAKKSAIDALCLVGLDESYCNRNPSELSGGEKRRVAIAGILAMKRNLLVFDEPAAGLDPLSHDNMFALLEKLNNDGSTVVIVSHDMEDIAKYCNKAVVIHDGKLKALGTPREVIPSPVKAIKDALSKNGIPIPDSIYTKEELINHLKIGVNYAQ